MYTMLPDMAMPAGSCRFQDDTLGTTQLVMAPLPSRVHWVTVLPPKLRMYAMLSDMAMPAGTLRLQDGGGGGGGGLSGGGGGDLGGDDLGGPFTSPELVMMVLEVPEGLDVPTGLTAATVHVYGTSGIRLPKPSTPVVVALPG
jgi:hypothetical protein